MRSRPNSSFRLTAAAPQPTHQCPLTPAAVAQLRLLEDLYVGRSVKASASDSGYEPSHQTASSLYSATQEVATGPNDSELYADSSTQGVDWLGGLRCRPQLERRS